ncbi:Na+/H+ antiporter [Brochothrix thermosphacta]|uniref:Na+/H+ antiporter n=1 Tax=Brochothrix thermosphacta TaxID=2756 RepID=UPI000E732C09|nr:Na+/H+ antiporter [Brochothrix thermosphacta]ANZ94701.1 Na+/H+ antiporter [Brochothrix thermosphacta]
MAIFDFILVMLIIIGLSHVINRFIPFVSVPLIQIALGAVLSFIPSLWHLELNPELFLVLFIAPLLCNDGKRVNSGALWNIRIPIILLAVGLVFVTTFAVGYFIHWMIPTIPYPAAFALAAILSPTDAVAVGSLSDRIKLPKNIMQLLEGEALMNDASGLVAFKMAIAAMVTGTFSIWNAAGNFVVVSVGGLIVGALAAFLILRMRHLLRRFGMEDVTIHLLMQIVTPFLIYLLAEEIGVSGILAVVMGGVVHGMEKKSVNTQVVKLNLVSSSTWDIIVFILNGLVFVILGSQIPDILKSIWEDSAISNERVMLYIGILYVILIVLRFVWVFSSWAIPRILNEKKRNEDDTTVKEQLESSAIISIAGVRGAVTLAGSMSIPFVLASGDAFPERSLIIFLAAGVILVSLIISNVLLPILLKEDAVHQEGETIEEMEARLQIDIFRDVIRELESEPEPEIKAAVHVVIEEYRTAIRRVQRGQIVNEYGIQMTNEEKNLRLDVLRIQEEVLIRYVHEEKIKKLIAYRLSETIQATKTRIEKRVRTRMRYYFLSIVRFLMQWRTTRRKVATGDKKKFSPEDLQSIKDWREESCLKAMKYLANIATPENQRIVNSLKSEQAMILSRLKNQTGALKHSADFEMVKNDIRIRALQAERDSLQKYYEEGRISREMAHDIRQNINFMETYLLDSQSPED